MESETVQIQSLTDLAERLFAKPPALQVSQGDIIDSRYQQTGGHVVMFSAAADGLPRIERVRNCSLSLTVCLSCRMYWENRWSTI